MTDELKAKVIEGLENAKRNGYLEKSEHGSAAAIAEDMRDLSHLSEDEYDDHKDDIISVITAWLEQNVA